MDPINLNTINFNTINLNPINLNTINLNTINFNKTLNREKTEKEIIKTLIEFETNKKNISQNCSI